MYLKVQLPWNVVIPAENLEKNGLSLQKAVILNVLEEFAMKRATKEYGYLLSVTSLDDVGVGRVRQSSGGVLFPVVFTGLTFKLFPGEAVEGRVHTVMKHGVFIRCGPLQNAYLSCAKMPGFSYSGGDNPIFVSEKMGKIERDTLVRVSVIATKWLEASREIQALVTMDGDYLGPVSELA